MVTICISFQIFPSFSSIQFHLFFQYSFCKYTFPDGFSFDIHPNHSNYFLHKCLILSYLHSLRDYLLQFMSVFLFFLYTNVNECYIILMLPNNDRMQILSKQRLSHTNTIQTLLMHLSNLQPNKYYPIRTLSRST